MIWRIIFISLDISMFDICNFFLWFTTRRDALIQKIDFALIITDGGIR